ncbi:hypothetical protein J2Y66_003481 [Paenarthrobacter nitroguajacolicus]|uniref:hypothetical protein n=1 Tax=Paenarthrobacter TaxID=1742992 RepID=UPI00285BCCF0|nr:hypothetical protein [Paenarthrobacter nitroguajacolicus]MDR6988973.1 hypothetical protein [Paenarthrobacter nitroguajacolicus]
MRRLFLMAMPVVMLLAACTAPSSQPTPGATTAPPSSASATAEPSQSPSSIPGTGEPGDPGTSAGDPGASAGDDEPGRYSYRCTSLDASPEVQLSSLAEVWAANNYTRMASCEVAFEGDGPFEPTPREAEAIATAAAQGVAADDALSTMLDILRLCTRISDETGPGGFAEAGQGTLMAAAEFCPDAPQGKILAAWAAGTRTGAAR